MMGFWKKFFAILQLAPMIIGLVKQVELALPGKGLGAQKLNLIMDLVTVAAEAQPDISDSLSKQDLASAVTGIAAATVKGLNATGVFVH